MRFQFRGKCVQCFDIEKGELGHMYEEDPESTYIGNWSVDSNVLYHRHPKTTGISLWSDRKVAYEYDVNTQTRECRSCSARCPDEVWFIHRMYQL